MSVMGCVGILKATTRRRASAVLCALIGQCQIEPIRSYEIQSPTGRRATLALLRSIAVSNSTLDSFARERHHIYYMMVEVQRSFFRFTVSFGLHERHLGKRPPIGNRSIVPVEQVALISSPWRDVSFSLRSRHTMALPSRLHVVARSTCYVATLLLASVLRSYVAL